MLGSAQEAQMMAHLLYRQARSGLSGTLALKATGEGPGGLPLFRPVSRVTLTWDLDETGDQFDHRNFLVDGVHLTANFGDPGGGEKTWDVSLAVTEYIL